jgi:hypothetical protein
LSEAAARNWWLDRAQWSTIAAGFLSAGLLVASLLTAAHADGITLQIDRLGHVYAPAEPVLVGVSGTIHEVSWVVTDMFGEKVRTGTTTIPDGLTTIDAAPARSGWFKLDVRDGTGSTAATSFVVIEPPRVEAPSDRFGVMTHFAQGWDTDILPLVARAGIGQVRDELYWQEVEKTKGHYAMPDRYTRYLDALTQQHIKLLLVLSFANSLYDGGNTPYTPEGRAAYAAYANYLVKTLNGHLSGVEVWNEFNGSFCKGPCNKDRPAAYADLLAATYPALKRAVPDLPVGGGAAVLVPEPWFHALFDHGVINELDAVVVHPYRSVAEGVELLLGDLRRLVRAENGGAEKPIWATEFSYHDRGPEGGAHIARYLVRHATIMLEEGVTRISWYLLRDYATFTTMGLFAGPESPLGRYAPTPTYAAYVTLIRQLDRAAPDGREATDPRTRLYRFKDDHSELRVGWSSEGTSHLTLTAPAPIDRVDLMGNATHLTPSGGQVELTLDGNPVYLKGQVSAIRESGRTKLLADSVNGFTNTPGADSNWSYGAYICPDKGGGTDTCLADYNTDSLEPLTWMASQWGYAWRSLRFNSLQVAIDLAHPSVLDGRQVWAIRRWTSHEDSKIVLTGTVERPVDKGDGSETLLLVDGRAIWRQTLGRPGWPDRHDFSVTTDIRVGSHIDFVVTPGPGTNIESDATHFTVRIAYVDPAHIRPDAQQ